MFQTTKHHCAPIVTGSSLGLLENIIADYVEGFSVKTVVASQAQELTMGLCRESDYVMDVTILTLCLIRI